MSDAVHQSVPLFHGNEEELATQIIMLRERIDELTCENQRLRNSVMKDARYNAATGENGRTRPDDAALSDGRIRPAKGKDHPYRSHSESNQLREERFRVIMDLTSECFWEMDGDEAYTYICPAVNGRLGYTEDQILGRTPFDFMQPQEVESMKKELDSIKKNGTILKGIEHTFIHRDGHQVTLMMSIMPVYDHYKRVIGYRGIEKNVTELKRAMKERNLLIRELNHRVKNNFQIVSGLLTLQAKQFSEPHVKAAFEDSQDRVKTMALLHDKLNRTESAKMVNLGDYIHRLAGELYKVYGTDEISFEVDCEDIQVDASSAVPSALIVNELVSNALKHGFPGGRKGAVSLRLFLADDGMIRIVVHDDGIGFPENMDFQKASTLGMQIVNLMIRQIEGTIEMERGRGTMFVLHIPRMD